MASRDLLLSIESVIEKYREHLIQIRLMVIDQQVSNYPIFIFQKPSQEVIGKRLIDASQNPDRWNIFLTHLEELFHKKVILEEKLDDFKFQYKNQNDKFCILTIDDSENYVFVFVPIQL